MGRIKKFEKNEIVRPHSLNGCTLYVLDETQTTVDWDAWRNGGYAKSKHLRGFEPLVIEDENPIVQKKPTYDHISPMFKVNYGGTVYAAYASSLARIVRKSQG